MNSYRLRTIEFLRLFWGRGSPKDLVRRIIILGQICLLSSCMKEIDSGARPLIYDYSLYGPSDAHICREFLSEDGNFCHSTCPDDTHEAKSAEKEAAYKKLENTLAGLPTRQSDYLKQNLESSSGICLPGVGIKRPDGEVYIKSTFCSCLNGKNDLISNCAAFCATTDSSEPTLFADANLGPNITLNQELGNLYNWCHAEIDDGLVSPSCELKAWDGENTIYLPVTLNQYKNSFQANLQTLERNKTYVMNLVEKTSGAKSTAFQIRRVNPPPSSSNNGYFDIDSLYNLGPLQMLPISQYSCITRSGQTTDEGSFYNSAARVHYYFPSINAPAALAPGSNFLICHDTQTYGENDSTAYPRLELNSHIFTFWSYNDIRFFDQNQNSKLDINDILETRLKEVYNVESEVNIFFELPWYNRPSGENDVAPKLGMVMQPWIDSSTGRTFCPTRDDYYGTIPIFKLLKDLVGVDTEAIYMSEREPQVLLTDEGQYVAAPSDVQLIREGLLKKVWFYFENGVPVRATEEMAKMRTIMYYHPIDVNYPFTKKANQSIYIVRSPQNIGKSIETNSVQSLSPADKRFGCIPLLHND